MAVLFLIGSEGIIARAHSLREAHDLLEQADRSGTDISDIIDDDTNQSVINDVLAYYDQNIIHSRDAVIPHFEDWEIPY